MTFPAHKMKHTKKLALLGVFALLFSLSVISAKAELYPYILLPGNEPPPTGVNALIYDVVARTHLVIYHGDYYYIMEASPVVWTDMFCEDCIENQGGGTDTQGNINFFDP